MSKFYIVSSRCGCNLGEPIVFPNRDDAITFVKMAIAELIFDECSDSLVDDKIIPDETEYDELSAVDVDSILAWGAYHDYCDSYNTEDVIDTFTYSDDWSEYMITEFDLKGATGFKTIGDYTGYFEDRFRDKVKEFMKDPEYSLNEAKEDATAFFLNECTDYDALTGMYLGYDDNDPRLALENFMKEIPECREDGQPNDYDNEIISRLRSLIEEK